jgi:uncharacterized protein YjbJ (UPF0337 family)
MRRNLRHHVQEIEEHSPAAAIVPAKINRGNEFEMVSKHRASQREEYPMGATADKIKGTTNEAIGKAKQGIGEATGSDRLQGEGLVQEGKGHAQKAMGDAKQTAKDAADKASDLADRKL